MLNRISSKKSLVFHFFQMVSLQPLQTIMHGGRAKDSEEGSITVLFQHGTSFHLKLFDGGLLKAELGSGRWSKYVSQ